MINKKIFTKIISLVAILVAFSFLFSNIFADWNAIKESFVNFKVSDIILVFLFLLPVYILNAFSWHIVTKSLKLRIGFKKNLHLWVVSNLSRYLPGGIWQYPSRVYLLSSAGTSKLIATYAVIMEALFNLVVGILIVLFTSFGKIFFYINIETILIILLVFILLLFIYIYQKFIKKGFVNFKIPDISYIWIIPLIFLFSTQYLIPGIVLYTLVNSINAISLTQLPIFVGIYTSSWIIGYITFFAPSGLGVQDVSIAALLSMFVPLPIASAIAILFRIILTLTELLTVLIVFWLTKKAKII